MKKIRRIGAWLMALVTVFTLLAPTFPRVNAAISTSTYKTKMQEFISDSRWKNGLAWADAKKPKLSTYSSIGCCAYVADFAAYVYGSKSKAWNTSDFTKFTNSNEIRAGDIIHTSNHWFVVLERNGNTLYTAEGNFDDKTRVTKMGWGIKNGTLYNLKATNGAQTFKYGFHYKFSDQQTQQVICYDNYSQKNYFTGTDFKNGLDTGRWISRNADVYSLAVDSAVKHDSRYNTLKIVGTAAGGTGTDLAFVTTTQGSGSKQYYIGDSKQMTMSFWAKGSVDGAKMYIRWGWQATGEAKAVTLTTDWKYYTIDMDKRADFGNNLHPYFDKAGTFWLSELQMEDGSTATEFVPENGGSVTVTANSGSTYSKLPTPTREGYIFGGWFTAAAGGSQVRSTDAVVAGWRTLYAHWTPRELYDVTDYRGDGSFTAPVRDGYVFAGWYADKALTDPLGRDVTTGQAYAKFVPEDVLSIKWQVTAGTTADTPTTTLRLITTVDSLDYSSVGFRFRLGSGNWNARSTTTVYSEIKSNTGGVVFNYKPAVFHESSRYFMTRTITGVPNSQYDTVWTVIPYWITLDGTQVFGAARQFTISDYYNR